SDKVNKKWFNTAKHSDKLSNISQAKHIDIKLKALGFEKKKSDIADKKTLLVKNQELFDETMNHLLGESGTSYNELHEASIELGNFWNGKSYEVKYNPKEYKTLFEKLIRCEHERWNSFHYLNGWEYADVKDKSKKLHNCLKPIEEFKEPELQITILYDAYSILYLPNYLANAGYELTPYGGKKESLDDAKQKGKT
ncbi:MAG: RyR domain-containing protein, partial [Campylobacterales bacterium]